MMNGPKMLAITSSLADLKARLRQTLEEQKKDQAHQAAKGKILDLLIEKHPFPVPKSMVERQVQNLISRAEIRLARQGNEARGRPM